MATKKKKLTNKDRARIERERRMQLVKKPVLVKSSIFVENSNQSDIDSRIALARVMGDLYSSSPFGVSLRENYDLWGKTR